MPIRNDDWEAIDDAIAKAIAESIVTLKPSGWRKALNLLREWGVLATIATVIVALLAIAAGAIYQATARVRKEATFETTTERDLKEIRGDIALIRADLGKLALSTTAALPLADFRANLSDLRFSMANARKQDLKIPSKIIDDLQTKLTSVDTDAPTFWPAAAEFISYRSINRTPWVPPGILPNCTDSKPRTETLSQGLEVWGQQRKLEVKLGEYRDCRLTLDSPVDGERLDSLLVGDVPVIGFYHCFIVYRGGPIKLALAWNHRVVSSVSDNKGNSITLSATGSALKFADCVFEFSIEQSVPSMQAQQLTRLILSQKATTIEIPLAPKAS